MVGKNRGLLLNGEIHLFYVTKQLIAHSEVEAVAVTPGACAWDRGIVVIVDGRALRARATDCCLLVHAC